MDLSPEVPIPPLTAVPLPDVPPHQIALSRSLLSFSRPFPLALVETESLTLCLECLTHVDIPRDRCEVHPSIPRALSLLGPAPGCPFVVSQFFPRSSVRTCSTVHLSLVSTFSLARRPLSHDFPLRALRRRLRFRRVSLGTYSIIPYLVSPSEVYALLRCDRVDFDASEVEEEGEGSVLRLATIGRKTIIEILKEPSPRLPSSDQSDSSLLLMPSSSLPGQEWLESAFAPLFSSWHSGHSVCLLLTGPASSGKTTISRWVLSSLLPESSASHSRIYVTGLDLWSSGVEPVMMLQRKFQEARSHSPSVLVIDDLDLLLLGSGVRTASGYTTLTEGNDSVESVSEWSRIRVTETLARFAEELMNDSSHDDCCIFVVLVIRSIESLGSRLLAPFRFGVEVGVRMPSVNDRFLMLSELFREVSVVEEALRTVARLTPNFVVGDLARIRDIAVMLSKESDSEVIRWEDLEEAINSVHPVAVADLMAVSSTRNSDTSNLSSPTSLWDQIGGYVEVKKRLLSLLHVPLDEGAARRRDRLGLPRCSGVLLYGPSGCGKTMLVRALASMRRLNFVEVTASDLFSMYTGETEAAIRNIFRKCRQYSPCVLVFDELDALAPKRGETDAVADSGSSRRALSQLLTEMNGLESRGGVFVVACTNRKDMIDAALLRPGRLDQTIEVSMPSLEERSEILEAIVRRNGMPVVAEVSFDDLAERTDAFSGADLESLCREACLASLRDSLEEATEVNQTHFEEAFARMKQ